MANVVITSNAHTFTVLANDYLNAIGSPCVTLNKTDITKVYINKESTFVIVEINNTKDFIIDLLGYLGGSSLKTLKIDSIDNVEPLTLQDVHDLFVTLRNS